MKIDLWLVNHIILGLCEGGVLGMRNLAKEGVVTRANAAGQGHVSSGYCNKAKTCDSRC